MCSISLSVVCMLCVFVPLSSHSCFGGGGVSLPARFALTQPQGPRSTGHSLASSPSSTCHVLAIHSRPCDQIIDRFATQKLLYDETYCGDPHSSSRALLEQYHNAQLTNIDLAVQVLHKPASVGRSVMAQVTTTPCSYHGICCDVLFASQFPRSLKV